ncbi:hypothetical protein T492DRAFT_1130916, partial [Pavlovales sp. CCMP2436]
PPPSSPLKRPFTADAIITNPVAFGHVHVAEALNIPLHIMFPQPWVGTHAFPHPMSGLSNSAPPSELNMQSYAAVDNSMWIGNAVMINTWRRKELHLPTLRFGSVGGAVLSQFKVPFSFMCVNPHANTRTRTRARTHTHARAHAHTRAQCLLLTAFKK